jgi:GntR family transcriptional regulator
MAILDSHSPVPLYHQTYLYIRDQILRGDLTPGEMLPSEIELAKALNIGRQTIRQAMTKLVEEGLIERFSGRGTFICENRIRNDFFLDRSFSQEMENLGKKASAIVLKNSLERIDELSPACFNKMMNSPCLHLTRLRFGDEIPIGLQEAIILTDRCPGLENHDFTHESLYRILTEIYHLEISEIYHVVNAVISTERIADLLKNRTGAPSLLEKSITYLSDRTPIEATTSYFRADKYEYSVRFKYMGSK